MKEKIGDKIVRLNLLSFEQAEEVYKQKKHDKSKKIGEIALELGYLELEQEKVLKHSKN